MSDFEYPKLYKSEVVRSGLISGVNCVRSGYVTMACTVQWPVVMARWPGHDFPRVNGVIFTNHDST